MKLVSCLLLLSANLALTTADTCCNKITVTGFLDDNANGEYSTEIGLTVLYENVPANNQRFYFKALKEALGTRWIVYNTRGQKEYQTAPLPAEDYPCPEDLDDMQSFERKNPDAPSGEDLVTITKDPSCDGGAPTTTTTAPTTTSNPCPTCRNVLTGPLSGLYKHVGSGDTRCTYDGCLYSKDNEEYCFQTGSDTVQEVCPTNL